LVLGFNLLSDFSLFLDFSLVLVFNFLSFFLDFCSRSYINYILYDCFLWFFTDCLGFFFCFQINLSFLNNLYLFIHNNFYRFFFYEFSLYFNCYNFNNFLNWRCLNEYFCRYLNYQKILLCISRSNLNLAYQVFSSLLVFYLFFL